MPVLRLIALLAAGTLVLACSRDAELVCGSGTAYREAQTAGTLRIPDDLSVPDESESLTIPGGPPADPAAAAAATRCLEESPAFSAEPQP